MVKNLPAMQESQVQSLGREDPWKRERLPTPVFLLKELWGQRSLAGCRPWDHKESDMTEWLSLSLYLLNLKEVPQGFSLAYLYCQPHYSYALQPLLKKKKKTGYLNTSTVIPQHTTVHLITQEYRSGLPFPSPEDLHNPGIQPGSPALQVDSLPAEQPVKPLW